MVTVLTLSEGVGDGAGGAGGDVVGPGNTGAAGVGVGVGTGDAAGVGAGPGQVTSNLAEFVPQWVEHLKYLVEPASGVSSLLEYIIS